MKISFAQLVGFLDFTTSGLLMSALDRSSSNRRDRTENSNQCTGFCRQYGGYGHGRPGSVVTDYHFSLLIVAT